MNSYAFRYECYPPPGRLSLLTLLSVPDLRLAGSGVVGERLDLPLCHCTIKIINMTRAMRTATKFSDVSIALVSGVREDWTRVCAECEKLRCSRSSYLLSWHKRHYRWRGGAVFYHEKKTILRRELCRHCRGHQNEEYSLFYSCSSSGEERRRPHVQKWKQHRTEIPAGRTT
jgi:hypothetical protein